jgi:hypothetical protein
MATTELKPPASDRDRALDRLKKRRDLQSHFVAYLVVNAAMWTLWAVTGAGYPWPAWVTGLWAIGLILNAWEVYGRSPITESDVQQELDRMHGAR